MCKPGCHQETSVVTSPSVAKLDEDETDRGNSDDLRNGGEVGENGTSANQEEVDGTCHVGDTATTELPQQQQTSPSQLTSTQQRKFECQREYKVSSVWLVVTNSILFC